MILRVVSYTGPADLLQEKDTVALTNNGTGTVEVHRWMDGEPEHVMDIIHSGILFNMEDAHSTMTITGIMELRPCVSGLRSITLRLE